MPKRSRWPGPRVTSRLAEPPRCIARWSRAWPACLAAALCAELIAAAGVPRVVVAWLEPPLFVTGGGADALRRSGVMVVEFPWLAEPARAVNAHLFST